MTARNTQPATASQSDNAPQSASEHAGRTFRVAAVSSYATESDDVILSDGNGRTYLFSVQDLEPSPLERAEADTLGMFFEPSQDSSWHTLSELRAFFYGNDGVGA